MATAEQAPILAIAAEAREFSGLLRYASSVQKLRWPVLYARRAEINGRVWFLVANGPGPRLAAEAVKTAVRQARPAAILSTGYCGGLDPTLEFGDVIAATEVRSQDASFRAWLPSARRPHRLGPILSIDRIASTTREKAELHSTGVEAVEMEAAGIAELAAGLELPFYCLRVVSDAADSDMPLDFNLYRTSSGHFSRSRIAAAAIFKPSAIPTLLSFDFACRRASYILGDFLADCRF